jgi:hypothetical protein
MFTCLKPPTLQHCGTCFGSGSNFGADGEEMTCGACDGGGYAIVQGDLGPTRSCPKGRPFMFNPGLRTLTVVRRNKSEVYRLREYVPDQIENERPTRAWELEKESSGEKRYVLVAQPGWHKCTCEGFVSEASRHANERALAEGEGVRFTAGCVHLDSVLHLLWSGMLDVPQDDRSRAEGRNAAPF